MDAPCDNDGNDKSSNSSENEQPELLLQKLKEIGAQYVAIIRDKQQQLHKYEASSSSSGVTTVKVELYNSLQKAHNKLRSKCKDLQNHVDDLVVQMKEQDQAGILLAEKCEKLESINEKLRVELMSRLECTSPINSEDANLSSVNTDNMVQSSSSTKSCETSDVVNQNRMLKLHIKQCEDMNHKWQQYNQRREVDIGKQREELVRCKEELQLLKSTPNHSTIASLKVELQMLQISSQELQRTIELEKVEKDNTVKLAEKLSKENNSLKTKLDDSVKIRRQLEATVAATARSNRPSSSQEDSETVMTLREVKGYAANGLLQIHFV